MRSLEQSNPEIVIFSKGLRLALEILMAFTGIDQDKLSKTYMYIRMYEALTTNGNGMAVVKIWRTLLPDFREEYPGTFNWLPRIPKAVFCGIPTRHDRFWYLG